MYRGNNYNKLYPCFNYNNKSCFHGSIVLIGSYELISDIVNKAKIIFNTRISNNYSEDYGYPVIIPFRHYKFNKLITNINYDNYDSLVLLYE